MFYRTCGARRISTTPPNQVSKRIRPLRRRVAGRILQPQMSKAASEMRRFARFRFYPWRTATERLPALPGRVPGPVNSPPKADPNRHLRPDETATLLPEALSLGRGRSAAD